MDLSTLPSSRLRNPPHDARHNRVYLQDLRLNRLSLSDYCPAPLLRVFLGLKKKDMLLSVTTLVLDCLSVPSPLLRQILFDAPFNIRILTIRDVKWLCDEEFMQILQYLIRPPRPECSRKLKELQYFTLSNHEFSLTNTIRDTQTTSKTAHGVTTIAGSHLGQRPASIRSQYLHPRWASCSARISAAQESANEACAQLVKACQEIVAFDAMMPPQTKIRTPPGL